jgi:recombination protein RecA
MGMALPKLSVLARIVPASKLPVAADPSALWTLPNLAGRLVEISGDAAAAYLTAAFGLVLDAQLGRDTAAWVTLEHSSFFPPDVAESGIDIDSFVVVRVKDWRTAARAADHLVRSGGFGLVVIDLASDIETEHGVRSKDKIPVTMLTRLLGLARRQNVAVLFLTKKTQDMPSLNSLISLRVEARWRKEREQYELFLEALKDKNSGQRWTCTEVCRGPAGLR